LLKANTGAPRTKELKCGGTLFGWHGEACWQTGFRGKRKGSGLQPGVITPHSSWLLPSSWRLSPNVAALPSQMGRI